MSHSPASHTEPLRHGKCWRKLKTWKRHLYLCNVSGDMSLNTAQKHWPSLPLDMGTWNATPHPSPTLRYLTLMTMTPIHHFPSIVLVLICSKGCSWPVWPPSSRRRPRKNTAHCLYPAHRGQGQSAIWAQQTQKSHKHLSPISSDPPRSASFLKVTSLPS